MNDEHIFVLFFNKNYLLWYLIYIFYMTRITCFCAIKISNWWFDFVLFQQARIGSLGYGEASRPVHTWCVSLFPWICQISALFQAAWCSKDGRSARVAILFTLNAYPKTYQDNLLVVHQVWDQPFWDLESPQNKMRFHRASMFPVRLFPKSTNRVSGRDRLLSLRALNAGIVIT